VCREVLKTVHHRHFVFSIPKTLRRYFLYDRSLLSELSHLLGRPRGCFSGRRSHKRVQSLGCLRPSRRNVCHLLSIGNHRWSFFLTYYSLFRIFSSSQSEFLSLTDGDGVAQDVISTYNYNLKTAYLRDIKSPLFNDRKI
jgi:hypothetical protein